LHFDDRAQDVHRHADGVDRVDIVEVDPAVVRLARTDPALARLNGHVYGDRRVHVTTADAFRWLRGAPMGAYDVVIEDLPDPGITASTKLYALEFYGLARRAMAPGGRLVVHAGPVSARPRVFWTVEATVRAAGLRTVPYRVGDGDFGGSAGPDLTIGAARVPRDWGFVLASRTTPVLALDPRAPRPPTLTRATLAAAARAAAGTRVPGLSASTLVDPRYAG
ncbi:spermidine synthase, partial [Streptomyces carpinensis]